MANKEHNEEVKCPYCDELMCKIIGENNPIIWKCENTNCVFYRDVNVQYFYEKHKIPSFDEFNWPSKYKYFLRNFESYLTSKLEVDFYHARLHYINLLNIIFKPFFTILDLRPVTTEKRIVNFTHPPCVANVNYKKDGPYNPFIKKIIESVFNSSCINFDESINSKNSIINCVEIVSTIINDDKNIESYFSYGLNELKTLVFIKLKGKDNNAALLTALLPFPKEDIEKLTHNSDEKETLFPLEIDFDKRINFNNIENIQDLDNVQINYNYLKLKNNQYCEKCGDFCECSARIRVATAIDIKVPDRSEILRMQEFVDKLEERICMELDFQRSQLWTLQYFNNKQSIDKNGFKFILSNKKRGMVEEEKKKELGEMVENYDDFKTHFNKYCKAIIEYKHQENGIIGDTLTTNMAEVVNNPWSDPREKKLLNERRDNNDIFSSAERYFYGKHFLDYTVIPIIIYNYYWGAVMFFHRGINKDNIPKRFNINEFINNNLRAVKIVNAMCEKFELLLLQEFLHNSYRLLLDESVNTNQYDSIIDNQFPFLPKIIFFEDIHELVKALISNNAIQKDDIISMNQMLLDPDLKNDYTGTKKGSNYKFGIRVQKVSSKIWVMFNFSKDWVEIPSTILSTCDLLVKEAQNISVIKESKLNEELSLCVLKSIQHFEGTDVLINSWDILLKDTKYISNYLKAATSVDSIDDIANSIHKTFYNNSSKIIKLHFQPLLKFMSEILIPEGKSIEGLDWWINKKQYIIEADVYPLVKWITDLCFDKYFVFPTGWLNNRAESKNFVEYTSTDLEQYFNINIDNNITTTLRKSFIQFILINLIKNTNKHARNDADLVQGATRINITGSKSDDNEFVTFKYWDNAKWKREKVNDKCKKMNKYFTTNLRDDKMELDDRSEGFAFRAIYLLLTKIPKHFVENEFVEVVDDNLIQTFYLPIHGNYTS